MRLSHSKLALILSNPADYYLNYVLGIYPKKEKTAFTVGSAVHWGLQYAKEDLTEWFQENVPSYAQTGYTHDQLLAESMVHGFLKLKSDLFKQILTKKDGTELKLVDEAHELWVEADLPSKIHPDTPHRFVGQIDLLLTTDQGFVLLDYKTSSMRPDWNKYMDQIYRYIYLLKCNFPDVPVVKIGIINLRKERVNLHKNESEAALKKRIQLDYELNEDEEISYHEYDPMELRQDIVDEYIENLTTMADLAETIDKNQLFYQNYEAINGPYKSDYWDIYYNTPDAYVLYNIRDTLFIDGKLIDHRDCRPFDLDVFKGKKLMNKYSKFKDVALDFFSKNDIDKKMLMDSIKSEYEFDDELLDEYYNTFMYDIEHGLPKKEKAK